MIILGAAVIILIAIALLNLDISGDDDGNY